MRLIGSGPILCLLLSACSVGQDVPLATSGAEKVHAMLDHGEIDAIVAGATADLNAPGSRAKFTALLNAVHKKLGALKSTKQIGWNDQATTGGHFISLNYQSTYEKGDAAENFVFKMEGARALLAGYHVTSDALILT